MALPADVAFAGWIPFAIVLLLSLAGSGLYLGFLRHRREREPMALVCGTLTLATSLITSSLLPVDVFLVSLMKNGDGTFKEWAANATSRENVEHTVLLAYYVLYGLLLILGFLILPFAYFFSEEKDDILENSIGSRICSALKYTSVFLLVAGVLLTLGAVIPMRVTAPQNSTEWEKIEYLVNQFSANKGEDALSFALSLLTLVGMAVLIMYTGSGLAALPVGLVAGSRSTAQERELVSHERAVVESQITVLRGKVRAGVGRGAVSGDGEQLSRLEEQLRELSQRERRLEARQHSVLYRLRCLTRPVQMALGVVCALLGLVLWLSLLLVNIDKLLHSLGFKMGYVLTTPQLPNPLDLALVYAQKAFPLDYVLFLIVVLFLVLCTIYGIQRLGIWFVFLRMYRIRAYKTRPQGILLLCMTLAFAVLGLNVLLYSVTPQYTTFGSQHYTPKNDTTGLVPCSLDAPPDECVMSRASAVLLQFFYKAWIFGACYYWATWLFLTSTVVTFVVLVARGRRSAVDIDLDDLEDSDDERLIRG